MGRRASILALKKPLSLTLACAGLSGWVLMIALDRGTDVPSLCLSDVTLAAIARGALATNSPFATLFAWLAMLLAMMPPLLAQPIAQLQLKSLARRRARAVGLFVAGYAAAWLAAGPVLIMISVALGLFAANGGAPAPIVVAAAIAAVWQASPPRQAALNRCHRLPQLSAFGARADLDCISFGLTHGAWCIAACAPLMLLPLTAPAFHLALMAAVSAGLILERMGPARPPRWTFRILPGHEAAAVLLRSIRRSSAATAVP